MISKLFKKNTIDDLLEELKNDNLKESVVDSMLKDVNIHHINQNQENFLHKIIIENKIESVKWLIKQKLNLNEQDIKGITPLMLACKYGYLDAVEELIKAGADVDCESYSGNTAIEFAVYNNYFSIYKILKPLVKDINRRNKKNYTLLHTAIKAENLNVMDDLFVDSKFNIPQDILFYKSTYTNINVLEKTIKRFQSLDIYDEKNRNILFYVIENGINCENIFLELLEKGLDINCVDNNGDNILLHLIEYITQLENSHNNSDEKENEIKKNRINELIELIPIILYKEIKTTQCNNKNETILSYAAKHKNLDVLKTLLDNDVDINILNNDNENALSSIITKGPDYLETIYLFFDYGINPNIKNKDNKTIIETFIDASLITRDFKKVKTIEKRALNYENDYLAMLESLLVNTDTNLTALNSKGEPYFFDAVRYGALDIVKLLIKYGADINQPDINGNNIIYKYMSEKENVKKESELKIYYNILHSIIMMGANVNAKDSFGGITLHKAILKADPTVVKMILHSGADINAIDNRGRHILHNTVWKNNIKLFKLIHAYNKNLINEPDKFGVLPINYAAFLGYTDMVLELIELNAHINNPYKKTKYIINFLKKFHKNLKPLIDNARTKNQKEKIKVLINNMKKEFEVES
ncbi:ankyrin repeat domain-containing protein [Halarcobacter sp.]|uniref:ankyrin repeat domain-containing protein n=1 Tax=Halarcobacter sp. TaxID=2321133 RepID=UPI002AAA759F|nr:ankyrin repeat domain-containing protein [Halarcobacter sp.]